MNKADMIEKEAEAYADSIHFCDVDFNNDEEKKFYLIGHPDGLEKLYQCSLNGYIAGRTVGIERQRELEAELAVTKESVKNLFTQIEKYEPHAHYIISQWDEYTNLSNNF